MKKSIYSVLLFCASFLFVHSVSAQLTNLVSEAINVSSTALYGNDLYYAYGGFNGNRKLAKINLIDNAITEIFPVAGLYGLLVHEDKLFLSGNSGIYTIDLTQQELTLNQLFTDDDNNNYRGLAVYEDEMYVGSLNETIFKFNLTGSQSTLMPFIEGINNTYEIVIEGDNLYTVDYNNNKIVKIDLSVSVPTISDVITDLALPDGLALAGNQLYIAEYEGNKISRINLIDDEPIAEDVVTNLGGPAGIIVVDNKLFICEYDSNRISQYTLPVTPVHHTFLSLHLTLHPNPTTNFVQIKGLKQAVNYQLFTTNGMKVSTGKAMDDHPIYTRHLPRGHYFLQLENGALFQFIRQ